MTLQPTTVRYSALSLTHQCNLGCDYCYARKGEGVGMRADVARAAIDFLADQGNDGCTVTFFGGEPLVEFELLKAVVGYAGNRHGEKIQFRMSTNGTLLDDEKLAYLKDHEVHFVLSIDGNEEQHDKHRRFVGGRGSYQAIVKHLPAIFAANPYTIGVSVVSPETAHFVAEGVRDLFSKGFRYVLQTLDYSAPWGDRQVRTLRNQYQELANFYEAAVRSGRKIYYSPFDERIKTWAQKPYGNGDLCDLANSQIAIAPSGAIYPCVQFIGEDGVEDRANNIGNVFDGFDDERRVHFIEENYAEKESCRDCALVGRCATYCGCVNWTATGNMRIIPPIICEHERMLMPIVDRMASRLWKDNVELFRRRFYEKPFPMSSYVEDCLELKRGEAR
jgi:uncharacterized protein